MSDPHNSYSGIKSISKPIGTGLFRIGTIEKVYPESHKMKVRFRDTSANLQEVSNNPPVDIYYPLTNNNGMFIGSIPSEGTNAVFGVDGSNQYYFVSYTTENRDQIPDLSKNKLYLYANENSLITLNKLNNNIGDIIVGSNETNIYTHLDPQDADQNLIRLNFDNEQHITQAYRKFVGTIKRESREPVEKYNFSLDSRINSEKYDNFYDIVSLDPTIPHNSAENTKSKNPPFVENRELIYEFVERANVQNDIDESSIYTGKPNTYKYKITNRRKTKSDTLSLSLSYPNYLIETIKGTVVDIFGNILDLNRFPLPVGKNQNTLNPKVSTNLSQSYLGIKALERKSVAYHFEINARKDFKIDKTDGYISDLFGFNQKFPTADYGKNRSRFYVDIDKEGQFKLNVPASSETGNIPLLTRYENFSNINNEDSNNPNKLIYHKDSLDILHDSFACPKFLLTNTVDDWGDAEQAGTYSKTPGSITLLDNKAPIPIQDRRYDDKSVHIKHGTAYHDILSTCYAHQSMDLITNYISSEITPFYAAIIEPLKLEVLKNVVSDTITVSGEGANAGGRSGAINFDGSIELNVGANTVDRQSLWLDTAGGIVANIGRDKKDMSAAISMNGNVFFQVGGFGVLGDSRFVKYNNDYVGAVLDLRVLHEGYTSTMIRIDNNGVTITTPTNFAIHATGDISITGGTLNIDVEECIIQGRGVNKEAGGSI
jgi:hypothetical protein